MARVLVIEDEPPICLLLLRIIKHMGHEVQTASTGSQAQALIRSESFDLVLSDLHIPGAPTVMELLLELRGTKPNLPIVVVSGYSTGELIEQCVEAGIKNFLDKPFEMVAVRTLVDQLVGKPADARVS